MANNKKLAELIQRLERDRKLGKPPPTKKKGIFSGARSIERSSEFLRIASIEERDWEDNAEYLAEQMTPLLKTPGGKQKLRPVQAAGLHDLAVYGGVVGVIRVGGGKTLMLLLAPYIMKAFRPLLLIPANLREKTKRDIEAYRWHWEIPQFIRIESFEWLAQEKQATFLDTYKPDLFLIDEAHRCKNMSSVVSKVINDYRNDCFDQEDFPDPPPFMLLSGTLTKDSIRDYWHLLRWALPPKNVPLPLDFPEMIQWSLALDARVGELHRVRPGALLDLCNTTEKRLAKKKPLKAARQAYRRRLQKTPGVICTTDSYEASSLRIHELRMKPPEKILKYFDKLRVYLSPDGQEVQDGSVVAQRAMELSLGFYQKWKHPPPKGWLERRSDWCRTCRHIIRHNQKRLYSELRVKKAIDAGEYPQHREVLDRWRLIEPTFKPQLQAVWVSDFALKAAIKWAKKHKGIVWVYHPAVGRRLSKLSGMPYYHKKGFDEKGHFIESHPHGKPMIASIRGNMVGKNLQHGWSTSLMLYAPSSGEWWEQIIGREHREGQKSDEVVFWLFVSCIEQLRAFWKAKELDAQYQEDTTLKHKLLFADITVTTLQDVVNNKGSLWEETLPTGYEEIETETETETETESE